MANYDFSEYANGLRDIPMSDDFAHYKDRIEQIKRQLADTVGINPSMYGAGAQNAHPEFRWEKPKGTPFNPGERFLDDSMQPAKRVEPKKPDRYGICPSCGGDTFRPVDQDIVVCRGCRWELTGMDVMDITQAVARIPDRKARDLAKRMLFIAEGNRNRADRQASVQPGALEAAP